MRPAIEEPGKEPPVTPTGISEESIHGHQDLRERLPETNLEGLIRPQSENVNNLQSYDLPTSYIATNQASTHLIRIPSCPDYFALVGLIVNDNLAGSSSWPKMYDKYNALFEHEVKSYVNRDMSCELDHEYRPEGYRAQSALIGVHACNANTSYWIAVSYDYCNTCDTYFSKNQGKKPLFKDGWLPSAELYHTDKYTLLLDYATCYKTWGLSFTFRIKKK